MAELACLRAACIASQPVGAGLEIIHPLAGEALLPLLELSSDRASATGPTGCAPADMLVKQLSVGKWGSATVWLPPDEVSRALGRRGSGGSAALHGAAGVALERGARGEGRDCMGMHGAGMEDALLQGACCWMQQ